MSLIYSLIAQAVQQGASDLHLSSGEVPRARIDGDLVAFQGEPIAPQSLEFELESLLTAEDRERFIAKKNLDKSLRVPDVGNFRLNVYLTRNGVSAVFRVIPTSVPSMEELGLPDSVRSLTELSKGLVLVTGPTGSGKSTTLASIINHLNQNYPLHILTIEDPIEFVHLSGRSLVSQREIGSHCLTFADALKYALREDPDVILVGEMRDLETISLALTAAETGHLVFGTLHTRGAGPSIDRIIDSFPANQQGMIRAMLADSLVAVVSQTLIKRSQGRGRVAAHEVMMVNAAVSNLVREGKTFQIPSIIQTSRKEGMISMEQSIRELISSGRIAEAEGLTTLNQIGPAAAKKISPSPGAGTQSQFGSAFPGQSGSTQSVPKTPMKPPSQGVRTGTGSYSTGASLSQPDLPKVASAATPLRPSSPPRPPGMGTGSGLSKPKTPVNLPAGIAPLKLDEENPGVPTFQNPSNPNESELNQEDENVVLDFTRETKKK